jgi:hypothetical protein
MERIGELDRLLLPVGNDEYAHRRGRSLFADVSKDDQSSVEASR